MKTFVLVLLLFSIKTNAQIIPLPGTATTSATPTSTTPTSTLSTTSSSPTSTSATTSRSSSTSSTSTTSSTFSTSDISTTSSLAITSPVVTSVDGTLVTTVVVVGPSSSTSTSQPTQSAAPPSDTSSGLSTGSIIGLSVAGGVAVIGLISFFIWKLTRKRFPDFDDGEPIKWPDLNTHGAGPPTGGTGFDELSRVDSINCSTADFHSNPDPSNPNNPSINPYAPSIDPYAPSINPNQPYRDDPGAGSSYYDPYGGSIPGTIGQGEFIPLTGMNSGGRRSPVTTAAGRRSPGLQVAYGRTPSPGLQAVYTERMSPRPQAVPPGYDVYGTR